MGYADDAALIAATLEKLRTKAQQFQSHCMDWGITLSFEKTEALTTEPGNHSPIPVQEYDGFDSTTSSSLSVLSTWELLSTKLKQGMGPCGLESIRLERRSGRCPVVFGMLVNWPLVLKFVCIGLVSCLSYFMERKHGLLRCST